jgi:hypothetical protein
MLENRFRVRLRGERLDVGDRVLHQLVSPINEGLRTIARDKGWIY